VVAVNWKALVAAAGAAGTAILVLAGALDAAKLLGDSQYAFAAIAALGLVVFLVTYAVVRSQIEPTPSQRPEPVEPACPIGPYTLAPGQSRAIRLRVDEGERIAGTLTSEFTGEDFDFAILDHEGVAVFERGETPRPERQGKGMTAYSVDWVAPDSGPWYLELSTRGRRVKRKITVDLEWRPAR
jgi:hypothetical protein